MIVDQINNWLDIRYQLPFALCVIFSGVSLVWQPVIGLAEGKMACK